MKIWHKALLTLFLLLSLGAVLLGLALWRYGSRYAEQLLIAQARNAGIAVVPRELSLAWLGLRANALALQIPRAWLGLEVSKVELLLAPSALFSRRMHATLNAALYSGSLSAEALAPLVGAPADGTYALNLKQLALAEHPQVRAFGVSKGLLNLEIGEFRPKVGANSFSTLRLELQELETKAPIQLPAWLIGQALPLSIPALSKLNSSIHCTLKSPEALQCPRVSVETAWGSLQGELSAQLEQARQRIRLTAVDLGVTLSKRGQAEIGPWLVHLSKGSVTAEAQQFRLSGHNPSGLRAEGLVWQREK